MISALVLAAGRSRRMGTQKLLLPVGGRPIVARVVDELLQSPVDEVLVVVRPGDKRIPQALSACAESSPCPPRKDWDEQRPPVPLGEGWGEHFGDRASGRNPLPHPPPRVRGGRVRLVVNPDDAGDMLSSVRCGLRALAAECDAALVVLGDQPGVSREVVAQMVRGFQTSGGIVVPTFAGRRGHPILLPTRYCEEVLTRYDEIGLRGLVRAHPQDVLEVEVATPEVLYDVDLPEDYRQAAERLSDRRRPGENPK